jgi:hypothetical protein
MTDMGILQADFLTRAAVAPSALAAAASSSARGPRRQNAGCGIGVNRRCEIITGEFRSA